jgi:predicted nucleotidyltransferase
VMEPLSDNIPPSVGEFIKTVQTNPHVEEIILFGSRATGDHRERSDVDLAIRGPKLLSEDWTVFRAQVEEAKSLYWISIIDFDHSPPEIQVRIRHQGKTIYRQYR